MTTGCRRAVEMYSITFRLPCASALSLDNASASCNPVVQRALQKKIRSRKGFKKRVSSDSQLERPSKRIATAESYVRGCGQGPVFRSSVRVFDARGSRCRHWSCAGGSGERGSSIVKP